MDFKLTPTTINQIIKFTHFNIAKEPALVMIYTHLSTIAKQLNITPPTTDLSFTGISIDTRTLQPGNLFIAIQGEQLDGHAFIAEATKKGAVALLVNHLVDSPLPQLIVPDTTRALGEIAARWREQFHLPVIGVTGSNGKTTLKNMIASILQGASNHHALATEGNLNNHIGLPLNLLRLNAQHQYAVLEMGMNHFGEIAYLTQLAKPTIAVINNASGAHLQGLKNVAGVAKAKGEIFQGLAAKGVAVLNRDDEHFNYWSSLIGHRAVISFGFHADAHVTADTTQAPLILIKTPQGEFSVQLALLGRHNVMNALAATAVAIAAGIKLADIKTGLEHVKPAPGRMQLYALDNQVNIIHDAYNANPASLRAAVNTLAEFKHRKILILGDMKELGLEEKELHRCAGEHIRAANIDALFTFGQLSAEATAAFGEQAQHFTERDALIHALKPHLTQQVTVLVKGSRSMHMEKIVAELVPHEQLSHAH